MAADGDTVQKADLPQTNSGQDTTSQEASTVVNDKPLDEASLKCIAKKYLNRIIDTHPSPSERYFDIRVMPGQSRTSYFGEVGDQCIMFHSNKVCLIALSPTHPIISQDKTISKINFQFEGHEFIDRLSCKPQGKSKKGSQKMHRNSPVCSVECADGAKYVITACLNSRLLEVNENLIENPNLLKEFPLSKGYVAIMQPNNWKLMDEARLSLPKLSRED